MVTGGRPGAGGQPGRAAGAVPPWARRVPPVFPLAMGALVVVVAGGIGLAAYMPRRAPLGPAVADLAVAALLLAAALTALARARDFAWHVFLRVGGWTLAAYVVIAGMLEYVFLLDHTPGTVLAVVSLMLVIFAVDIPLLLAFSVARYQPPRG